MRPKLLMMKAFGPYGGTEIIDFTILEDTNMFLIHGPTGAGKTTILDAICYALYGYTNGGERTAESMRSKFAKEDEGAEVELIFTIRENEYKIMRSPRFERPKKRGTGTTVEEVKAILYKKEEDDYLLVAAKPQEVDRKIQELLTFNIDQFRQVIMIAQNQFRELLTASSKDRQKILQDIFETGVYQSVEKQLELLNNSLTGKVRDKELTYQGILEHIEHEEHEVLKQYINTRLIGNAKEVTSILGEMIADKKELIETNTETLNSYMSSIKKLQQSLIQETEKYNKYTKKQTSEEALERLVKEAPYYEQLKKQLDKASKLTQVVHVEETIKGLKEQITGLKEDMNNHHMAKKQVEEKLIKLQEDTATLEQDETRIGAMKKEYQHLESYKPRIEVLEKDKETLAHLNEEAKSLSERHIRLDEKSKKLLETIQQREAQLKEKETLIKAHTEKQLLLQKVQMVLERKSEIQGKEQEIQGTRKAFVQIRDQITSLTEKEKEIGEAYDRLVGSWAKSQAGELAKKLEANKPCPVCGSTTHPQKALQSEAIVSIEQIKAKEEERRQLTGQISKLKEEQEKYLEYGMKLKTEIEITTKKMQELMEHSEQVDTAFRDNLLEELETRGKQIEALQKQELYLAQEKLEVEKTTKEITDAKDGKAKIELQIIELKTKIQSVTQELPEAYHEVEVLKNRLLTIQKEVTAYEEQGKVLREALEKNKLEAMRYGTMLEEKKEQLEKQQQSCQKAEEQFQKEKETLGIQDQALYNALKEILVNQESYTAKLQQYITQKAILETSIKELAEELQDFQVEKLREVQEAFEKANEEKEALQLRQAMLTKQIANYTKQIEELEVLYHTNEALVKKQKVVGMMSSLAKGKNAKGLSFERYIQSSIFDEVLESANQKLRPMTSARYELFRTDDMKRKNAQAGLDIAVIDHYVGEMRPVNTLSGGESFMAALALALGLADVISRLAGAANLDTMFIDEGFGTLDEESLEMAIKVLLGLQDTGRLVGIISHVRELREQIPAKLEIISTKEGSRARFRV